MATYLDDEGKLRDENQQLVDEWGEPVEDLSDESWPIRETMEDKCPAAEK